MLKITFLEIIETLYIFYNILTKKSMEIHAEKIFRDPINRHIVSF